MIAMWMVRGDGGRLYEEFKEKGVAAIGWADLAEHGKKGMSREQLKTLYRSWHPEVKPGAVVSAVSQVWRFINEISPGDRVATYSPANRTYLLGEVKGEALFHPEWADLDMSLARTVDWQHEVARDALSAAAKNSLGSTLTIFQIPTTVDAELHAAATGKPAASTTDIETDEAPDPLDEIELLAVERIKDLVSTLDWSEMQDLVAGILRAMGYKTQVSPVGADRGKDIIASPDGFGFENPRIVVEVKHRSGQMGSQALRSFLGGRHKDDRGLYVSTGGFSKDAYYEADRAQVPLTLWTLDNLVRALLDHYDATDAETKRIVPLKRMYWPA
ncbi:MAG: restriction endonuclease [Lysobacter sp.]